MANCARRLCKPILSSFGLIAAGFAVSNAGAQGIGGELPATDLRIDLGQLYTLDDATGRHLSFSELRGTIDARRTLNETNIELSLDGRGRYGWSEITTSIGDVNRAYLSLSGKVWSVTLGRQVIASVNGARVDGASAELDFGDNVRALVFGGLMPHPLSGALSDDLLTIGAGYDARFSTFESSGGINGSWYQGAPDRIYLTERINWRPSAEWMIYGNLVIDLIAPRGLIGDLMGMSPADQSGLAKIDLSQGNLSLRWRPSLWFDVSLQGSHYHTLLPNLWWQDYLERERARRGFVLDGLDPVGSRRSYLRAVFDLHLSPSASPYFVLRADRRHEDGSSGAEATVGLKLNDLNLGYIDLSATLRDYFGASSALAILSAGTELSDAIGFDAGISALRVPWIENSHAVLYDLNAALWMDLRTIAEPLGDVRLMAMVQSFIDPEMVMHIFYLRIGYRFRAM